MNTSVDKSSKKRKSLSGQNKVPAKTAKLDVSVDSPKTEKPVETVKNVKSPKKQLKPENKALKTENGVSPKLNKFQGIKSLEGKKGNKKQVNGGKASEKKEKKSPLPQNKKGALHIKMQKRVEKEGKEAVIKHINEKIDEIVSRSELSKTSKRTLRAYKFILNDISGDGKITPKPQNQVKKTAAPPKDKKQKLNPKAQEKKVSEPKEIKKNKEIKKVEEEDESEDVETSFQNVKNEDFEDDSDEDAEEESDDAEEESEDAEGESDDEDSDEEEEGSDEDGEESEEENEVAKETEPKKVKLNNDERLQQKNKEKQQKKSRYVLFIGNIAYDTTKEELSEHFKKVGDVVDVRIPKDKEFNKPRGFAYVELSNEAAYQKALDLNGSQLKNRKIKVEYTQGGNKNSEEKKKQMKSKNFKLHAMRQQGKQGQKGSPNKGSPFKGKNKK